MKSHRILAAAAVAALAVTPAALAKKGEDNPGKGHGPKAKNVVVKGVVKSVDGATLVVTVPAPKGKGQAKKPSGDVTFTLGETTKLTVADTDGDGAITSADLAVGDKVVVQARGADVRHVVDQTHPPVADDEGDDQDDAPAPAPAPAPAA
jgi:hypothetical protein